MRLLNPTNKKDQQKKTQNKNTKIENKKILKNKQNVPSVF